MRSTLIICVAALVISGLGGFLILRYGQARYDEGVKFQKAEQATAQIKASTEEQKNLESVSHETEKLDDPAVDRALSDLGIMRQPADR